MDVPRANTGRAASNIPVKASHNISLPTSHHHAYLPWSWKCLPVQLESEHEITEAGGEGIVLLSLLLLCVCVKT